MPLFQVKGVDWKSHPTQSTKRKVLKLILVIYIILISFILHLQVTQNIPVEDSQSEHLESALRDAATRYNSALDMTLKVKQFTN